MEHIQTINGAPYTFFETVGQSFSFKVKAPSDAHIILSGAPIDCPPCFEIFIGGWKNTKCALRLNKNPLKENVIEVATPKILSEHEFKTFWVTWDVEGVHFGFGQRKNLVIFEYPVKPDFKITHFGLGTKWGASGSWIVHRDWPNNNPEVSPFVEGSLNACLFWLPVKPGDNVPREAVKGGFAGEDTYVGRARIKGNIVIGNVVPSKSCCNIIWQGKEYAAQEYEVLVTSLGTWEFLENEIKPNQKAMRGTESPMWLGAGKLTQQEKDVGENTEAVQVHERSQDFPQVPPAVVPNKLPLQEINHNTNEMKDFLLEEAHSSHDHTRETGSGNFEE